MKRLDELGVSPAPWRVEGGPMAAIVYENKPTLKRARAAASKAIGELEAGGGE